MGGNGVRGLAHGSCGPPIPPGLRWDARRYAGDLILPEGYGRPSDGAADLGPQVVGAWGFLDASGAKGGASVSIRNMFIAALVTVVECRPLLRMKL